MPPGPPPPPAKRSNGRWWAIGALVIVLALVAAGAAVTSRRGSEPTGPPSAPTNLSAEPGKVCVPPACPKIRASITISWDAPTSGAAVTGYDVYTGVVKTGSVEGATTTFEDRDLPSGLSVNYQVVARSAAGDSPRSLPLRVVPPDPPDAVAQLTGDYHTASKVLSLQNIDQLEGIEGVKVGDTTTYLWGFEALCAPDTGPCPTKVFSRTPPIRPHGNVYSGTSRGADNATCGNTGEAPVFFKYRLITSGGVRTFEGWRVQRFEGTYTVTFSCFGVVSTGTLSIVGRAALG